MKKISITILTHSLTSCHPKYTVQFPHFLIIWRDYHNKGTLKLVIFDFTTRWGLLYTNGMCFIYFVQWRLVLISLNYTTVHKNTIGYLRQSLSFIADHVLNLHSSLTYRHLLTRLNCNSFLSSASQFTVVE